MTIERDETVNALAILGTYYPGMILTIVGILVKSKFPSIINWATFTGIGFMIGFSILLLKPRKRT